MGYKVSLPISAPNAALIAPEQAKNWVRGDPNDDTDLDDINLLIATVMSHLDGIDGILRRALISQGWCDVWDRFPAGDQLRLALTPVQSVVSVTYFGSDGVSRDLDGSAYSLHSDFVGSYVRLASGRAWPSAADRDDAVKITYIAGYGENASSVPAEIRTAGKKLLQLWYGADDPSLYRDLPPVIMNMLRRFIRPHF